MNINNVQMYNKSRICYSIPININNNNNTFYSAAQLYISKLRHKVGKIIMQVNSMTTSFAIFVGYLPTYVPHSIIPEAWATTMELILTTDINDNPQSS